MGLIAGLLGLALLSLLVALALNIRGNRERQEMDDKLNRWLGK